MDGTGWTVVGAIGVALTLALAILQRVWKARDESKADAKRREAEREKANSDGVQSGDPSRLNELFNP